MKQKFIVDDIVMYNNKIMIIKELRDANHFDLFYPKEGLTYCYVYVDNIKPVNLTSAILEKNGWKFYEHHEKIWWNDDDSWISYNNRTKTYINLRFYTDENCFLPCLKDKEISGNYIKYVHELQHLLFGLDINHEMGI